MALSSIWVVVEPSNGALTTTSLELLSHARSLAADVRAITWGEDAASLAAEAGEFGATTLYDVGDLAGALPGVPVASASPAAPPASYTLPPGYATPSGYGPPPGYASPQGYMPPGYPQAQPVLPTVTYGETLMADGEKILYRGRQHWAALVPELFWDGVATVLGILVVALIEVAGMHMTSLLVAALAPIAWRLWASF